MTNQASEDELTKIIDRVYLFGMNGGLGYGKFYNELSPNDAKAAIQAIIRTEKLKLLDEVRERVVDKPTGNHNADSLLERDVLIYNQATAYLRTELTKLEAEL